MALPAIDSLRCFDAAARLLRFRAAARAVGLTPAAFGHRIRQLEDELGVRLFERTTRTVRLTAAGLSLVPQARLVLDAAAGCVRAARGEHTGVAMDLVIGTRHELGVDWLTPALRPLREKLPHLTVHLYFGSGPDIVMRVRSMEIDCAVTSTRLGDPMLEALPLHEETYVFVASPKLLRKHPLREPDDAAAHTLVDASADLPLYTYFRDAASFSLPFARVQRIGTTSGMRALAVSGDGVAVLPTHLIREDLRAKRLVRLFPAVVPRSDWFKLVFRRDDPRRSAYEAVAAALLEVPLP